MFGSVIASHPVRTERGRMDDRLREATQNLIRALDCFGAMRLAMTGKVTLSLDDTHSAVMPRFRRGIQYATASRSITAASGILGRPLRG
jgi:hypothetical protein